MPFVHLDANEILEDVSDDDLNAELARRRFGRKVKKTTEIIAALNTAWEERDEYAFYAALDELDPKSAASRQLTKRGQYLSAMALLRGAA